MTTGRINQITCRCERELSLSMNTATERLGWTLESQAHAQTDSRIELRKWLCSHQSTNKVPAPEKYVFFVPQGGEKKHLSHGEKSLTWKILNKRSPASRTLDNTSRCQARRIAVQQRANQVCTTARLDREELAALSSSSDERGRREQRSTNTAGATPAL